MARSSGSTPPVEPGHAAAILPGVPLPDWALSGDSFLPEIDLPAVVDPVSAPVGAVRDVNLDDLSIADMEAALRGVPVSVASTPSHSTPSHSTQAPAASVSSDVAPAQPAPVAPPPEIGHPTFDLNVNVDDDLDDEPEPYEFAVPGYPSTPAATQLPKPHEQPGYPTHQDTGPIVVPPAPPARALVIPPPPPPPRSPAPEFITPVVETATVETATVETLAPQYPVAQVYNEPVRVDLPMSAVLAREFTRTTPWESGRMGRAADPVPSTPPIPTTALVTPLEQPTAPIPVVAAPAVAATSALIDVEPAIVDPTSVEPTFIEPSVVPLEREPKSTTSPKRLLVLIGLGSILALIAAAVAFFLPGILNPAQTPDPVPTASSAPSASTAGVTPTTVATSGFVLQTPTTVGPFTRLEGPIDLSLKAATTASIIPGLTGPVSAVYGTDKTPQATVMAWQASTPPAATSVSQAFAGFQTSAKTVVTNISGVSSTGLPGQMSCGETSINGTPTTLCFWADPSTFGSVTVIAPKTPAEGALTAAQIRSAVEVQQ